MPEFVLTNDQLDNLFRMSMENIDPAFSSTAWQEMEKRIDEYERANRFTFGKCFFAEAGIMSLSGFGDREEKYTYTPRKRHPIFSTIVTRK